MSKSIGDSDSLKFELGDQVDGSEELRYLNIWIAGKKITISDDIAFVEAIKAAVVDDLSHSLDFSKFESHFSGGSLEDAHKFIVSTRDPNSNSYNLENDAIFSSHQILNWGPNTDDILCFFVPYEGDSYITFEFMGIEESEGRVFSVRLEVEFYRKLLKLLVEAME